MDETAPSWDGWVSATEGGHRLIELIEGTWGTMSGSLSGIRYRDERSGFTVGDFDLDDGRRVAVVGTLTKPEVGEEMLISGEVKRDPQFGIQFHIEERIEPETSAETALGYLGSGLIKHIGKGTAAAIVDAFGADTLRILTDSPERLLEFRGITRNRLPDIRRSIRETIHLAPVVGLLDPMSVSMTVCRRITRRYGASATSIIRANPWRLAGTIVGVAFTTADNIAKGLGAPMDAPERIDAAVLEALRLAARNRGDIVTATNVLIADAAALAKQSPNLVMPAITRLIESHEIVHVERPEGYALPSLAAAEQIIATKVRLFASWSDENPIEVSAADLLAIEQSEGIEFDPSQRDAIFGALHSRISVITGPPGSGKTTIVRAVLDIAEARGLSYALMSYTGRAAKRLAEATHRRATTIHRFLGADAKGGFSGPTSIPDLLVVDEASMLDSMLTRRLFSALPPYVRLLLVGDIDQLPAIGPGNVLGDLISSSHQTAVFRLEDIHRTRQGSNIPILANNIREPVRAPSKTSGRMEYVLTFDNRSTIFRSLGNDSGMEPAEQAREIANYITEAMRLRRDRASSIQVLCPMKSGEVGVNALNLAIQEVLNPHVAGDPVIARGKQGELRIGDRIMQTRNHDAEDVYNGEVWYLTGIDDNGSIEVEWEGERRILPSSVADGFVLAYAITVHKAQGSEFPIVIMPMHKSAFMGGNGPLERRLLYTAVSRARSSVLIVGQMAAVAMTIGKHDSISRRTLLGPFLAGDAPALEAVSNILFEEDEDFF